MVYELYTPSALTYQIQALQLGYVISWEPDSALIKEMSLFQEYSVLIEGLHYKVTLYNPRQQCTHCIIFYHDSTLSTHTFTITPH